MNCDFHPQVAAVGECRLCGVNVCGECMTVVKGNVICPECIRQVEAKAGKGDPIVGTKESIRQDSGKRVSQEEPKSKFLIFLLSFLPGLGHLYLGLTRQGIELMMMFFGAIWLIDLIGGFPISFAIPFLFFYGLFDALQKRDRMARGEYVDPNVTFFRNVNVDRFTDKKWLGWGVIGLGSLILLTRTDLHDYLRMYDLDDALVAVLLVVVGIWMLMREKRGGKPAVQQERVTRERETKEEDSNA